MHQLWQQTLYKLINSSFLHGQVIMHSTITGPSTMDAYIIQPYKLNCWDNTLFGSYIALIIIYFVYSTTGRWVVRIRASTCQPGEWWVQTPVEYIFNNLYLMPFCLVLSILDLEKKNQPVIHTGEICWEPNINVLTLNYPAGQLRVPSKISSSHLYNFLTEHFDKIILILLYSSNLFLLITLG